MLHERRMMTRYCIDAAIQIGDDTGYTINLSGNGVLFESARSFEPGEQVALVFPFEHAASGPVVTCDAHVIRVEPRGNAFCVAATYRPVAVTVRA